MNGIEAPLVTVVMPAYNAAAVIRTAVESILQQTEGRLEFVIIDDGSGDATGQIVAEYERQDRRVRVLRRAHQGYVPHLNEGLAVATGMYYARMDADDIALPERFAKQIQFLEEHRDVVAVSSSLVLIDRDGDPFTTQDVPCLHEEIDAAHLRGGGGVMPHPSLMARTNVLRAIGGYCTQYEPAEDLDLLLRLAEVGRLANIVEPLLKYRVHNGMTSIVRAEQQRNCVQAILAETWKRRGLSGVPPLALGLARSSVMSDDIGSQRFWSALNGMYLRTARKYAGQACRRRPFSCEAWRMVARANYASLREWISRSAVTSDGADRVARPQCP